MNLEHIAREVSAQMSKEAKTMEVRVMLTEFLRRCLSKITEQAVEEPVAYMYPDKTGPLAGKCFVGGAQSGDIARYTESQLIAAQQKVAEACAKVCEKYAYDDDEFVVAIRNGKWREYL